MTPHAPARRGVIVVLASAATICVMVGCGAAVESTPPADAQSMDTPDVTAATLAGLEADVVARVGRVSLRLEPLWGEVAPSAARAVDVRVVHSSALATDPEGSGWVARVVGNPSAPVIEVDADNWAKIDDQARDFVLAHELTHVVSRMVIGESAPAWWEEGFAEFSAARVAGAAASNSTTNSVGWTAGRAPASSDFYGADAEEAYAVAESMVKHTLEIGALANMAETYRLADDNSRANNPDALLDQRLRSKLGVSTAELLALAVAESARG